MIIRTISASSSGGRGLSQQRVTTVDGKRVMVASIKERIAFWKIPAMKAAFPLSSKAVEILLGIHVTTGAAERNWSAWGLIYRDSLRSKLDPANAEMMVFVKVNEDVNSMNWVDDELILLRLDD